MWWGDWQVFTAVMSPLPPARVCRLAACIGCGVDIWWLWRLDQRNLPTPGMNVESLTKDGLWLREEVKIIVYTCWLFLRDAVGWSGKGQQPEGCLECVPWPC